jgi:hypothetical protein
MKTIVVSGAHSNVGKTRLAEEICRLLPGAIHVKIGHGEEKDDVGNVFYHVGTPFYVIADENQGADFLVIESNTILKEIQPDCTIFLPGGVPKPSAVGAVEKADIVRGERIDRGTMARLVDSLGIEEETVVEIISMAGAVPEGGCRG